MSIRFRPLAFLLVLCLAVFAACRPVSQVDTVLNDVESFINDAPDSARTVLQSLDTTILRTKRLKARYALLRTMAQAKCYDDTTIPGLLDPDADWFSRHGSPDEKLKLWFYRGGLQLNQGNVNEAAIAFSQAETYADKVQDLHALGLLYLSQRAVYNAVYNRAKEQEYAEKAVELFKRIDDPLTGSSLGTLACVYHAQQKWALADSVFRLAIPYFEDIPALAPSFLSDYAQMKVEQPHADPAGAITLLNRYLEFTGGFTVSEAGAYAYALELLGNHAAATPILSQLESFEGTDRYTALIWLAKIALAREDYQTAYWAQAEVYQSESEYIQKTLEDSVTQALRDEAARQAKSFQERFQLALLLAGGVFFALLSLVLFLLLHKSKIRIERDRLIDLREQMQEELEKVQEENAEKAQLISGQENRLREMEDLVAKERETYTRERVNRLRQLGELRSTFWWRERGGMRESDAIQRIKKEISYVYQTDNDGVALVRRLDAELDGAISQLRKRVISKHSLYFFS
ncbi:MAG: hypothetical protein IKX28_04060 [Bacteroidales bacterium]|nr:hypothetical protein [Bacteroidales bacterium]